MTIEEKAKAYDEAKARMSRAYNENRCSLYFMSEIFPEPKVPKDDDMRLTIIQFLEYASSHGCPDILSKEKAKTWIAWLEKQGEKKSIWHREDEQNLNACLSYIPDEFLRRWLTGTIHVKYDKSAWSEEDEEQMEFLILMCDEEQGKCAKHSTMYREYNETKDWLKSLKDRVQLQWKPSEEQIQAPEYQVNSTCKDSWQYKASKELLEQLKKL